MNTKTIPERTPAQRLALVATVFAAGVLASAIGKRRSRHTALVQSAVIAVVGALLAWFTGFSIGATEGQGARMVAAAFGLSLGVASECVVFSRVTPGHAA